MTLAESFPTAPIVAFKTTGDLTYLPPNLYRDWADSLDYDCANQDTKDHIVMLTDMPKALLYSSAIPSAAGLRHALRAVLPEEEVAFWVKGFAEKESWKAFDKQVRVATWYHSSYHKPTVSFRLTAPTFK
ncbi:hypothetical protein LTR09_008478 [Extremus antarcticus]|uniref:Uncharacterized protein n=1 Tax=Extremus antarcticus TaxID=702011 RepID=A0AAJ0DAV2_9PEZI|nr:hypothetical protein LTR09_008478 [Extremus antarcticus]